MGQVWSMLEGMPGQERKLTLERGGKQFTVAAKVRHFLGEEASEDTGKRERQNRKLAIPCDARLNPKLLYGSHYQQPLLFSELKLMRRRQARKTRPAGRSPG